MPVDTKAATDRLMRFLAVEGVTGQGGGDRARAQRGAEGGRRAGRARSASTTPTRAFPCRPRPATSSSTCPAAARMHNQPRIMFMTHMDTVPLCAGAKPKHPGPQDRQRGQDRARRRQPLPAAACW